MRDLIVRRASALLLALVLSLVACSTASCDTRAARVESRLMDKMQQLSILEGAILEKQVTITEEGNGPECQVRRLQSLFGTNELSFEEVLDFYSSAMQNMGWHFQAGTDRGRGFVLDGEFFFDVSDLYNVSYIGDDVIQKAKGKYRTIYLIDLATPVNSPMPSDCREATFP